MATHDLAILERAEVAEAERRGGEQSDSQKQFLHFWFSL
jgi:hypothetical protein